MIKTAKCPPAEPSVCRSLYIGRVTRPRNERSAKSSQSGLLSPCHSLVQWHIAPEKRISSSGEVRAVACVPVRRDDLTRTWFPACIDLRLQQSSLVRERSGPSCLRRRIARGPTRLWVHMKRKFASRTKDIVSSFSLLSLLNILLRVCFCCERVLLSFDLFLLAVDANSI